LRRIGAAEKARALRAAAFAAALAASPALARPAQNGAQATLPPPEAARWQESPAHRDLFAPGAWRASYRAFVSPLELGRVLRLLAGHPELLPTPGGWQEAAVLPLDAFGQAGSYNRWQLLRLYGPERARVARGPRVSGEEIVESWTLVSPYPDPTLQRLEAGTLLILLRLP
jgi:hypothetical protein